MRTLAKLHRVDPSSVGLETFGKSSGFYGRQLKTLGGISLAQAAAVDVDTKTPVGKIPHFDDMVSFFSAAATAPRDRGTLIHGDYKIDNLVYHKTEARVIGILDWEMSTIGHPLSDLSNLMTPYVTAPSFRRGETQGNTLPPPPPPPRPSPAFAANTTPGLPPRAALQALYAGVAGWDPSADLPWSDAFALFRNCVIIQGIKARLAQRNASSAKAAEHARLMEPFGHFAWALVAALQLLQQQRSVDPGNRRARFVADFSGGPRLSAPAPWWRQSRLV